MKTRVPLLCAVALLCAIAPAGAGEAPDVLHDTALSEQSGPRGIAIARDASLWVIEARANRIAHVDARSGKLLAAIPIPTADAGAHSIVRGAGDTMVFTESRAAKIATISAGGTIREYSVGCRGCHPGPLAVDAAGNVWFGEMNYDFDESSPATSGAWGPSVVGKMSPDGTMTEFPVPTVQSYPSALAIARDGSVWFTETRARIGHMAADGTMLGEIATPGVHQSWIGTDDAGVLRVLSTDAREHNVGFTTIAQAADGQYRATTKYAPFPGRTAPTGASLDRNGNIWFADASANRVARMSSDGSAASLDLGGATASGGAGPFAVAVAQDGTIWIAEMLAGRIVHVRPRE